MTSEDVAARVAVTTAARETAASRIVDALDALNARLAEKRDADAAWTAAIMAAVDGREITRTEIARLADISRARLYQIIREQRRVARPRPPFGDGPRTAHPAVTIHRESR